MKTEIQIFTLGRLLIERNGVPLENFISTKAALLFIYLAMHPGSHTRKKLAAMFWSETSDEQALKNLRTVLSSIRQQVEDALEVTHDELAINSNIAVKVDAIQFENGFKKVFSSPETLDALKSTRKLESLYQGIFLNNIAIRDAAQLDEWISDTQRRLHEIFRQLLFEIVAIAQKRASYDIALEYAWKLVNLDPLWDAAQRQVMRLLTYTNRANEALRHYEQFAELLDVELQVEPESETTELYEQIRARNVAAPVSPVLSSVVFSDIPFIETVDDIEIAQRMLNTPHCRLLTILGISGIGKTALATQLAFHRQHLYSDGACFVALSIAQSPRDILNLVANALNMNYSASMAYQALEDSIIQYLKTRQMLLILDNYEQLLPETGFVQRILEEATSIQLIVTSHTQLSLYREWLLPLRGLRLPEIGTINPLQYEAIQLFEMTAQRINPRFNLQDSVDDVIRICHLVDGLPLGIVIAAGWVQYMPPDEILAMMKKDLLQMEAVHQDIPARHQSFQGLANAMLAHLSPSEQQALMCLAIFEGSFSVNAALAVADITPKEFKELTDKCLVQATEGYRYTVHSIVRQVFKTHLESSPDLNQIAARYVTYFQQWCDDLYARAVPLHEIMHTIDAEHHNLWNVIGLSSTERHRFLLHIGPALNEYWVNRGYHAKGILELLQDGSNNPEIEPHTRSRGLITLARILERTSQYDQAWEVCEQVLDLQGSLNPPQPEIKGRALRVLSEICSSRGDYDQASQYLHAIIAMGSQVSLETNPQLQRLVSLAYEDLGEMLMSQGDYDAAVHYIEVATHYWRERGETLREAIAQSYLGIIAIKKKDFTYAFQVFEKILHIAKQANNQTLITIFCAYLGKTALEAGQYERACALCNEALPIAVQIDRKKSIIMILEMFSQLALQFGYGELSVQLFGFSVSMQEQLNLSISPHNQADYDQYVDKLMTSLGDSFESNFQIGSKLSLVAVVQLASSVASIVENASSTNPSFTTSRI